MIFTNCTRFNELNSFTLKNECMQEYLLFEHSHDLKEAQAMQVFNLAKARIRLYAQKS